MSSASKALELLSLFTLTQPEIGLSEMCRLAKRDKATTYRHLQVLEKAGFIEQNTTSKRYRLGPALLQLGRMREATVPRKEGAETALVALAEKTGETAHVSVLSGTTMFALISRESPQHSTRAVIDVTKFPLHATASGVCAVAFGPDDLFDLACNDLKTYTDLTPTTPEALQALVADTRTVGMARSDGRYQRDINSISAPIFDQTGLLAGAVSVASVASRFTPELESIIQTELMAASRHITKSWGGVIPASIEKAWLHATSPHQELDTTS
ncbi:MAG: IclR family transcriptional regulator [Tateyamaria sp.]|uniref:IclR family transcriptional regulator n=1 Tax=Tateyamaria sp. TaxID=1929288 RepID=UPI003276593E